ncbi:MAG: LicD family protein, partial [Gammaproteobacteria bacterium]
RPRGGMGSERARAALFAVADALEAAGVRFVLTGGTALGCVRERDFIGHDNDIDLCALPGSDAAAIAGAFDQVDALRVEAVEYQDDLLLRVIVGHEQGARTDVFLYHEAPEGWWFGIERGREALAWIDSPFEPRPAIFHGREFLLPHPAERYLVENYGPDWRTPNPWHVAGFTAHNLRNDYFSFPRSIGYALIGRSLRDGLLAAAGYYTDVALAHEPAEPLLRRTRELLDTPP